MYGLNSPQVVSHSRRCGSGNGVSAGNTARIQSGCTFSSRVVPGPDTKMETCRNGLYGSWLRRRDGPEPFCYWPYEAATDVSKETPDAKNVTAKLKEKEMEGGGSRRDHARGNTIIK